MAVTILGATTVADVAGQTSYTVTSHTCTSGTDTLLVVYLVRAHSSGVGLGALTCTWNSDPVTELATNYDTTVHFDDVVFWAGARNAPDAGAFDLVLNLGILQRAGTILLLNLDGTDTADLLGALDQQRRAAAATNRVDLTIGAETPTGNLAVTMMGMTLDPATTLSSFVGTGWTDISTGTAGPGAVLCRTIRSKAAATGAVAAVFAASNQNLGGVLLEIRGATGTFSQAVTVAATPDVVIGQSQPSRATAPSAVWLDGLTEWASTLILQADDLATRNLLRVGDATVARFAMSRRATAQFSTATNVYSCQAVLSDGDLWFESAQGSLTVQPSVVTWAHSVTLGEQSELSIDGGATGVGSGVNRIGSLNMTGARIQVGGLDQTSPPAFTGLLGFWIVDRQYWRQEQRSLFAKAILEPDLVFGWGTTDAKIDSSKSPIALPLKLVLRGASSLTVPALYIDPDGTQPNVVAVGAAAHGGTAIVGGRAVYTPTVGFLGLDRFTYSISDGGKSSSSSIEIDVQAGGLVAQPDTISVGSGGSVTFDPKGNDTGGIGTITIVSVQQPTLGSVTLNADNRITYQAPSAFATIAPPRIASTAVVRAASVARGVPPTGRPYAVPAGGYEVERERYGTAVGGPVFYVSPGGTGSGKTTRGSPGDLVLTVENAPDGARVIALPGTYGPSTGYLDFGCQSGKKGRVQLLADNPVFIDVDLSLNGGMLGYSSTAQHSVLHATRFNGFGGLWIEGFRIGLANNSTTDYTTWSGRMEVFGPPVVNQGANDYNWFTKNYVKNINQTQAFVPARAQKLIAFRNYFHKAAPPTIQNSGSMDYFIMFDRSKGAEVWAVENYCEGRVNHHFSVKEGFSDAFIFGNYHKQQSYCGVGNKRQGGEIVALGQTADQEDVPANNDNPGNNTGINAEVAYNTYARIIGGTSNVWVSNCVTSNIHHNNHVSLGSAGPAEKDTCTPYNFTANSDYNSGANPYNTILGPDHPTSCHVHHESFNIPSQFSINYGSYWIKTSVQAFTVTFDNNTASADIGGTRKVDRSDWPPSPAGTSWTDAAANPASAPIRVHLGTNAKVNPPSSTGIVIV